MGPVDECEPVFCSRQRVSAGPPLVRGGRLPCVSAATAASAEQGEREGRTATTSAAACAASRGKRISLLVTDK